VKTKLLIPKQVYNGDGSKIGGGVLERTLDKEIKEMDLIFTDTSISL
jgi:hypothetical protein